MNIPARAAAALAGQTDETTIAEIIKAECRLSLERATAQLIDEAEAAGLDGVAA